MVVNVIHAAYSKIVEIISKPDLGYAPHKENMVAMIDGQVKYSINLVGW